MTFKSQLWVKAWEVARDKSRGGWGCSFHAPHFYIFIVGSRRIGNALHNGAKAIFKWNSNCIHSKCELLSKLITRSCLKLNCIADAAAANDKNVKRWCMKTASSTSTQFVSCHFTDQIKQQIVNFDFTGFYKFYIYRGCPTCTVSSITNSTKVDYFQLYSDITPTLS